MEFGSERFGTWIAKRVTVLVAAFVVWSWFVASPSSVAAAWDRTGDAWCDVFPCPSDSESSQPDLGELLPDPHDVWSGLDGVHSGVDGALDSMGLSAQQEVPQ
jgi:hypothetical protein